MEPVKPLCDLCVRSGVFNSIMLSYQALDDVFDTQLGIPYHCNSGSHERAYHAYDGYTSPFEATSTHANPNLCRYCERHYGRYALFISVAASRTEVTLRCPYCEQEVLVSLP
jgi:hypothetical protein